MPPMTSTYTTAATTTTPATTLATTTNTAATASTNTTTSSTTEKKSTPVSATKIGNDVIPTFSMLTSQSYRQEPKRRPTSINFFLDSQLIKSSSFLTTPDMYFLCLLLFIKNRFKETPEEEKEDKNSDLSNSPTKRPNKSRFDDAPTEDQPPTKISNISSSYPTTSSASLNPFASFNNSDPFSTKQNYIPMYNSINNTNTNNKYNPLLKSKNLKTVLSDKKMEERMKRFQHKTESTIKAPSYMISQSKEEKIDEEFGGIIVQGTSQSLEKEYLRLTGPPDPTTVRPEPVLKLALTRVKKLWKLKEKEYLYIWNQLKSIRQDMMVQHIKNNFTIDVYECHARIALEAV